MNSSHKIVYKTCLVVLSVLNFMVNNYCQSGVTISLGGDLVLHDYYDHKVNLNKRVYGFGKSTQFEVGVKVNKYLSVQLGLGFKFLRSNIDSLWYPSVKFGGLRVNYLVVPVLVRFALKPVNIDLGYIGHKVIALNMSPIPYYYDDDGIGHLVTHNPVANYQHGLLIGLNKHFNNISVDLRYTNLFNHIFDTSRMKDTYTRYISTQYFSLALGYFFKAK